MGFVLHLECLYDKFLHQYKFQGPSSVEPTCEMSIRIRHYISEDTYLRYLPGIEPYRECMHGICSNTTYNIPEIDSVI